MSSNCTKCGTELIGTRKFCTACGAPVVDPRAPAEAASPAPLSVLVQNAEPVNPFAVTAGPNMRSPLAPPPADAYGPPPGQAIITPNQPLAVPPGLARQVALSETETDPKALPMLPATPAEPIASVSPLAVSSLVATPEDRKAVAAAREALEKAEAEAEAKVKKTVGTQIMPSAPRPPVAAATSAPSASTTPSKRPDRTRVMPAASVPLPSRNVPAAPRSAPSTSKMPVAPPASGSAPPGPSSAPGSSPGRGSVPPPIATPRSVGHAGPGSQIAPQPQSVAQSRGHGPYAWPASTPAVSQPAPSQAAVPWSQPAAAGPQVATGYVPGVRVLVTWANGQRFPATVKQVTPAQCLVVFDNGQMQWVDLPYLTPV